MAYTLESSPAPIIISTTAETVVHQTAWEKALTWLSNMDNISYLLIGSLAGVYGAFILVYVIHKLRKVYKRAKRKRREERRWMQQDKQPMLDDESFQTAASDSPIISRLTYHGSSTTPNKTSLYPPANKTTMYPPRPQVASTVPAKGPIKKMTTIMAKPKTQIIVRCRCEGRMHVPGCPHFSVPDAKPASRLSNPLASSTSDVSLTMRDAMDKVALYERELKTNPSMQALLQKYRLLKQERARKTWDENAQKGNWQAVPIAQLLERKKEMKERNSSSMS